MATPNKKKDTGKKVTEVKATAKVKARAKTKANAKAKVNARTETKVKGRADGKADDNPTQPGGQFAVASDRAIAAQVASAVQVAAAVDQRPAPAADRIVCGDSLDVLRSWPDGCVDLVFADPPFNIGYKYHGYNDRLPYDRYVRWTHDWVGECRRVLKDDGSIYIAIGDKYAAEVRLALRAQGLELRSWIIWHYTFGQNCRKCFSRSHAHILYAVKDPRRFTFNDDEVRIPSARQLVYHDSRANPKGRLPDDTWNFSRVCGTFRERCGWHPCQMPESLLDRIIRASSRPGDLVVDPFSGSGTTCVVARRLGRRFVGIELSDHYAELARQRVAADLGRAGGSGGAGAGGNVGNTASPGDAGQAGVSRATGLPTGRRGRRTGPGKTKNETKTFWDDSE